MDDKQTLLREIFEAHREINDLARCLRDLASDVEYLHPRMADDLMGMANAIDDANVIIRRRYADILNADLKASQDFTGKLLVELVNRATGGEAS